MTPEELREGLYTSRQIADTSEEGRKRLNLLKSFHFHTGCRREFLAGLADEDLMSMWARFVIERVEEVS